MTKIIKWLDANHIPFEVRDKSSPAIKQIAIVLERDLVWVNGYGENMMWNKEILITQDAYKKYSTTIATGYNKFTTLIYRTGKQTDIIIGLTQYFEKSNTKQ